jgi:negative regulator of flagellin synthesis FlgM
MQIYGPTHVHGPQSINAPHAPRSGQAPSAPPASSADRVDISQAAQLASQLADVPDVRQERIDAIRQAIADGTYETPARLDQALERLLDEIG